jgi:hypothetical protein
MTHPTGWMNIAAGWTSWCKNLNKPAGWTSRLTGQTAAGWRGINLGSKTFHSFH